MSDSGYGCTSISKPITCSTPHCEDLHQSLLVGRRRRVMVPQAPAGTVALGQASFFLVSCLAELIIFLELSIPTPCMCRQSNEKVCFAKAENRSISSFAHLPGRETLPGVGGGTMVASRAQKCSCSLFHTLTVLTKTKLLQVFY